MAEVILDKSYLQGLSADWFRELREQHTLLMTDPLLREMVTTQPNSMASCFRAFPPEEDPVVLIPEIGVLLEFEIKEHRSCLPLSARRLQVRYAFHPDLRKGRFPFGPKQKESVEKINKHHDKTAESFYRRSATVPRLFPELRGFRPGQPRGIVDRTMDIAKEPGTVRARYSQMRRDNYPDASAIDGDWLLFRLVQAQLLGSIECFSRYRGQHFSRLPTEVEHLRQDVDYLALASLTGGLASRDNTLTAWFQILRPDGLLIN